jgi:hypothetical protein
MNAVLKHRRRCHAMSIDGYSNGGNPEGGGREATGYNLPPQHVQGATSSSSAKWSTVGTSGIPPIRESALGFGQSTRSGPLVAVSHNLAWSAVALLCFIGSASPAEITVQERTGCQVTLTIKGQLVESDGERVAAELRGSETNCKDGSLASVTFDSPGGSVREALIIGRAMRKHRVWASVGGDAICASSCVLAFVGAAHRRYGKLGVHRPFFEDARGLAAGDIDASWRQLDRDIREYLQEMNVSPMLGDLMIATPPEKVRWLTYDEQEDLRIAGDDPIADEIEIARMATYYRMSSVEYRKAHERTRARCEVADPDYMACCDAAVLGISLPESRARRDLAKTVCSKVAAHRTRFDGAGFQEYGTRPFQKHAPPGPSRDVQF